MDITETIKLLVDPANKLIDAVFGAIGNAYEPRNIKKTADAKAYEINSISKAMRNNSDIPIVYNSTGINLDTSNYEEIVRRASNRLAYQEIKKQQNIESVFDYAYDELSTSDPVSNEPVSPDWIIRFFNSVEDISDEEMHKLWGHILAGEIKNPCRYSLRTLEKLHSITRKEAEIFEKAAHLAFFEGSNYFIYSNFDILRKYDINFANILLLEDCGLMVSQAISYNPVVKPEISQLINNNTIVGFVSSNTKAKIEIACHIFTESGKQLLEALAIETAEDYAINCLKDIKLKNKHVVITAHKIIKMSTNIEYQPNDLLTHDEASHV
jgi:Protein of unknown function (DUF2806).